MTRAYLGGLSVEIPSGWEDQSLMTLLGPPLVSQRLLRAKQESVERASLVMRRQSISGPAPTLSEFAQAQEEMMTRLIPGARVMARGEQAIGSEKPPITALMREFSLPSPTGELRQLQMYFFARGDFYVLCGTDPNDLRFDEQKKEFLKAAARLRVEPTPEGR